MTIETLSTQFGQGGANLHTIRKVLKELQGLQLSVVAGAAAGTTMNVAAMRTEDTVIGAIVTTDAGGALADDTANITIQSTKASATATLSTAVATNSVTFQGTTFTFAAASTGAYTSVGLGASDTAAALNLSNAINAVFGAAGSNIVTASAAGAVVTITAKVDGTAGNAYTLTKTGATITVTGAGFLAGGTATGGIKSITNLTGKSLILAWFNKK